MKVFWSRVLASCLSLLITGAILFIILTSIIGQFKMGGKGSQKIYSESYLMLDLGKVIPEHSSSSLQFDPLRFSFASRVDFFSVLQCIENAKTDDRIAALVIRTNTFCPLGYARLEELRNAIVQFSEFNKPVYAYGNGSGQKSMYLASLADTLSLMPGSLIDFRGFGGESFFLKETLERFGINAQVIYHGTFKGATEPFRLEEFSEANKAQIQSYLSGISQEVLKSIAVQNAQKGRLGDFEQLNALIDTWSLRTAEHALKFKLVDQLQYEEAFWEIVAPNEDWHPDKHAIGMGTYFDKLKPKRGKAKVALVFAQGDVVDFKGSIDQVGAGRFTAIVNSIKKDEDIKAVVLRINSPGGSAFASEKIWHALKGLDKPLVVSMSDLAASAGYQIPSCADFIFGLNNTLTGSIGVFMILPDFSEFQKDRFGINYDEVNIHTHANVMSTNRPLRKNEMEMLQSDIDDYYQKFLEIVAEGRSMSTEAVDQIGEGRVFTGKQAVENGLIDAIGGLQDAISKAAALANLEEFGIVEYPQEQDWMEELYSGYSIKASWQMALQMGIHPQLSKILDVLSLKGAQARLNPTWDFKF